MRHLLYCVLGALGGGFFGPSFANMATAVYTEALGIDLFTTTLEDFVDFVIRAMLIGLVAGAIIGLVVGWQLASKSARFVGAWQFITNALLSILLLIVKRLK